MGLQTRLAIGSPIMFIFTDHFKTVSETRNMFTLNKIFLILLLTALILCSCSGKKGGQLKPERYEKGNILTIENGNIKAVFVDNEEIKPDHRAGYNGIARLYHAEEDSLIFVPAFAGFNLEHIFAGDSLHQLFEPRLHPMTLFRKTDNEVLLYQDDTPLSGVESLTSFKVVAPHYIDITFTCVLHNKDFFKHGYAGFFWASYINKPADKKIYFKGAEKDSATNSLVGAWSEKHGVKSTHVRVGEDEELFFADNFNASLASHFSDYRYSEPYFFGRFGDMVLAYFFDAKEIIRFSQSPDGGGELNPAWDFQYIVPSPQTDKKYSFKARLVYKPFVTAADIDREYQDWKGRK
jgi:hypothetical protein